MAEFKSLSTAGTEPLLITLNLFKASSACRPLMASITSLTFLGETFKNLTLALASLTAFVFLTTEATFLTGLSL